MASTLSPAEQSVLSYIAQARHLPDMPAEFWHALAILRSRGLVLFRNGHWVPNEDLLPPSAPQAATGRRDPATGH